MFFTRTLLTMFAFLSLHLSFSLPFLLTLPQSAALKEGLADPNRTSGQRPQPQGCLDTSLHCYTSAATVGPKHVLGKTL